MLTEWGQACDPYPGTNLTNECVAVMATADSHFMGWTDWYFGERHLSGADWDVPDSAVSVFARTYARKIAGEPRSTSFDQETKEFKLCFIPDKESSAVTEIYLNRRLHYPLGAKVEVTRNLEVVSSNGENIVYLRKSALADHNDVNLLACVTITAVAE